MKVRLSYCVFTGSAMIEGLRTSFILGGWGGGVRRTLSPVSACKLRPVRPLFRVRVEQLLSAPASMTAAERFPIGP